MSVCFETEIIRFYRNFTRTSYCKMSYFFPNLSFEIRGAAYLPVRLIHECLRYIWQSGLPVTVCHIPANLFCQVDDMASDQGEFSVLFYGRMYPKFIGSCEYLGKLHCYTNYNNPG